MSLSKVLVRYYLALMWSNITPNIVILNLLIFVYACPYVCMYFKVNITQYVFLCFPLIFSVISFFPSFTQNIIL